MTVRWKKRYELHRVPGALPVRRHRRRPYWRSWAHRLACYLAIGETWPWPDYTWVPWGSRSWWQSRDPATSYRPHETYCSPDDDRAGPWTDRTSYHSVSIFCSHRRTPSPTRGRMICSLRCKYKIQDWFLRFNRSIPSIVRNYFLFYPPYPLPPLPQGREKELFYRCKKSAKFLQWLFYNYFDRDT